MNKESSKNKPGRPYDNVNGVFTDQRKEDLAKLVITLYTDKTNNPIIENICKTLDITRGTFYRYLKIKGVRVNRMVKNNQIVD